MKAAVIQLNSTPDVQRNLALVESHTRAAAAQGAKLVVLPEGFAYIGPEDGLRSVAEPLPAGGPILQRMQQLARTLGVEMILGGFWEQISDDSRVYNASLHLDTAGRITAHYRKLHLFDVKLYDGTEIMESKRVAPGGDVVVANTALGIVGLSICYDVRFPELYRALVDRGATVLSIPSAFTYTTGKDHWHILLRARAIEAQCHVLAAAQVGVHYGTRRSFGHALIVGPWGEVLAECADDDAFAIATIDPNRTASVRVQLPSLKHRVLRA